MSTNGEPLYDLQPELTEYFLQFGRVLLLKVVNKELSTFTFSISPLSANNFFELPDVTRASAVVAMILLLKFCLLITELR
jgi:hypothetical protein